MIQSVTNYIIGTFLWVSSAALIGVAGNAAAQAGLVSSTIVVTSVVLFVPSEFSIRLLLCLIGFCWALVLSLGTLAADDRIHRFFRRSQPVVRSWRIWPTHSGRAPQLPSDRLLTWSLLSLTTDS